MKVEDGRKVYVSDESVVNALRKKRERCILTSDGEKCVCVTDTSEEYYLSGESFETTAWKYFAEIPKVEKRPMTQWECLKWASENPNLLVKDGYGYVKLSQTWCYECPSDCKYAENTGNPPTQWRNLPEVEV